MSTNTRLCAMPGCENALSVPSNVCCIGCWSRVPTPIKTEIYKRLRWTNGRGIAREYLQSVVTPNCHPKVTA